MKPWSAEMKTMKSVFEELKAYLSSPLILSQPMKGEKLYLYLAISKSIISVAIVWDDDRVKRLLYYNNNALQGTEMRYKKMEKLSFSLIHSSRKMKPYFQDPI